MRARPAGHDYARWMLQRMLHGGEMAEPFCVIPWTFEGFREIRVFNGAGLDPETLPDLCRSLGDSTRDSETVERLRHDLEEAVSKVGLRVAQFLTEPDHKNPLALWITVTVMRPRA